VTVLPWCDFGGFLSDLIVMISALATLVMAAATVWMAHQAKRSANETAQMAMYTKDLADATAARTELDIEYGEDCVLEAPVERFREEPYPGKFFRVRVHNTGQNVARRCEVKIVVYNENQKLVWNPALVHWARRFPPAALEKTTVEYLVYDMSPVDINKDDWEYLDTFYCERRPDRDHCFLNSDRTRSGWPGLRDEIKDQGTYWAKATVYCENAKPISKWFKLSWTGKLEDTQMGAENPPWTG